MTERYVVRERYFGDETDPEDFLHGFEIYDTDQKIKVAFLLEQYQARIFCDYLNGDQKLAVYFDTQLNDDWVLRIALRANDYVTPSLDNSIQDA